MHLQHRAHIKWLLLTRVARRSAGDGLNPKWAQSGAHFFLLLLSVLWSQASNLLGLLFPVCQVKIKFIYRIYVKKIDSYMGKAQHNAQTMESEMFSLPFWVVRNLETESSWNDLLLYLQYVRHSLEPRRPIIFTELNWIFKIPMELSLFIHCVDCLVTRSKIFQIKIHIDLKHEISGKSRPSFQWSVSSSCCVAPKSGVVSVCIMGICCGSWMISVLGLRCNMNWQHTKCLLINLWFHRANSSYSSSSVLHAWIPWCSDSLMSAGYEMLP